MFGYAEHVTPEILKMPDAVEKRDVEDLILDPREETKDLLNPIIKVNID